MGADKEAELTLAANQGNAEAQYKLGFIYTEGGRRSTQKSCEGG